VLEVGGSPASAALIEAIQQLEVEDHADLADMLRMRVGAAVRDDGAAWTLLDDALFTRLAEVKVSARVAGQVEPLIHGYVIDVRASLSNQPGTSTIDVVAMDASVLMSLEEKVKAWPNKSDGDIATQVFGDYGFTTDVGSTQPARQEADVTTLQRGNDLQLIRKLADRNGFEFYLDLDASGGVVAHFHAPRLQTRTQGVLNVNLGSDTNVDDFNARYDMMRATTASVTGLEVSSANKQPAQASSSALPSLGQSSTVASDRPRTVLLSQTGLSDAGELRTLAQAVVDRSGWAITAEGSLTTAAFQAVLRAKEPVLVRGAGRQFSGTYYVERVLHVFGGDGYTQKFTLRRNASGLAGGENFREDHTADPQPARSL
jgi:phage protein D